MRLIYVICILLTTTICCIATDNANATQGDIKATSQQIADPVSKAVPLDNSTSLNKTVNASVIATTNDNNSTINITTPLIVPTNATIANVNVTVTNNTKAIDNHTNTDRPVEQPSTTTATITTESIVTTATVTTTTTTTEKATTTPTVTSTAPNNRSDNIVAPEMSTVSVATKTVPESASTSEGRTFDGLSFVGGIIMTVCSIGIVVLSVKFYRSVIGGNYHLL